MNDNPTANNAVSIYGQEGLDDFPVLKAFQQYIDAEQSKARKRMIMLCLFFGFLMTIVIVVFMIMLREADERNQLLLRDATAQNQALNDKLVEFAMKERERQPVVVQPTAPVQNAANDAAIKAMTDTLAALQKHYLLTIIGDVTDELSVVGIIDDSTTRHIYIYILSICAMTLVTTTVAAMFSKYMPLVSQVEQGPVIVIASQDNRPALAAVAAVRSSVRVILHMPQMHGAPATLARATLYLYVIYKI